MILENKKFILGSNTEIKYHYGGKMQKESKKGIGISSFKGQFWLVVMFEFFERGAYYGMMSFISVYFVNILDFPKENVGIIKGVIQPLLYFLPIISGALADRFGYRKLLMLAFTFLGGGYFLTSQVSSYGAVFAALVIMGVGAGIFKPLISASIAKTTTKENSTLGFGIFYWTINLGAFLFPLILVPFLKAINPTYVIIASAICTASMIIPTILFFKDPVKLEKIDKREQTSLIQTLANAFEIIYSPIILLCQLIKKSRIHKIIIALIIIILLTYSIFQYLQHPPVTETYSKIGILKSSTALIFKVKRNMLGKDNYKLTINSSDSSKIFLEIYKPAFLNDYSDTLTNKLQYFTGFEDIEKKDIQHWIEKSDSKILLTLEYNNKSDKPFSVYKEEEQKFYIQLDDLKNNQTHLKSLVEELHKFPVLAGININDCIKLHKSVKQRPFFLLFVISLLTIGIIISNLSFKEKKKTEESSHKSLFFIITLLIGSSIWFLPGLALLGRIIASVIYFSITSLFIIDQSNSEKFIDHAKFLLMIFLYSGFWVLYFQMFDSVLWYVQAYVNSSSLNHTVNNFLGLLGININWFFDVEHVTVINAGTIILLQLIISSLVKKTKALPTMMFGIALGTIGMAILAINTSIWIFITGMIIFSIGEMTAHPKFISYIGLVAPKDKKAMYMGYLFLYGVFGSAIGGVVGAKLYVHFVDNLNQPKTLWLIFAGIGLFTIISLALYNKFLKPSGDN